MIFRGPFRWFVRNVNWYALRHVGLRAVVDVDDNDKILGVGVMVGASRWAGYRGHPWNHEGRAPIIHKVVWSSVPVSA